jgi:hypothetical protein
MRMVRRWLAAAISAATMLLMLVSFAGPARAQEDVAQAVYASIEHSIRQEFEAMLDQLMRGGSARSPAGLVKATEFLKLIAYNKAALFATCAAETEGDRPQRSNRIPSAMNIVLTTCVEIKFSDMDKFAKFVDYAGLFFPDRIARCGEQARLAERERALPPYGFLQLVQPRLYEFSSYNKCLMASE